MLVDNGMQLFTEAQNSAALANAAGGSQILVEDPSGNPVELFQPAG